MDKAQKNRMVYGTASPDFLDPALEGRRIFSEVWGTFLLVVVAVGARMAIKISSDEVTQAMAVTAPGLMVMVIIYFMGTVSGAHLNPAVTLAFALRGNFPWIRVPAYILAQLTGGIAAAYFLQYILETAIDWGATMPGDGLNTTKALIMEILLTAGLVNTILGTAAGARNIGPNGAIAVGGYIILAGLWASPFTGASMNPVRSLAPDIVRGNFNTTWIYIAGPFLGALIGVFFEWILKGKATASGTIAAQGTLGYDEEP